MNEAVFYFVYVLFIFCTDILLTVAVTTVNMLICYCALIWFTLHNTIDADKSVGFPEGIKIENSNHQALVAGNLPKWLKGYYLRQLCGAFGPMDKSTGTTTVSHFFDCIGMIGSYRICPDNNVKYANKYYGTKPTDLIQSKISWNTLFTHIDVNKYKADNAQNILDFNPNMDLWTFNNNLLSAAPTSQWLKINIHTLNTIGNYDFRDGRTSLTNDDIVVNGPTEQVLDSSGTTWGITMVLHNNQDNTWDSFRLIYYITKDDPTNKKILSKFPLNTIKLNLCKTNPNGYLYYDQRNYQNYMGYLHTFAVTDSYIILPVSNYVMNPCYAHPDARKSPTSLLATWFYTDARRNPLTLLIFFKSNGQLFKSISIPSSSSKDFISHIVNAYEVEGHAFLDTVTFQDQRILTQYFQTSFLLNNVWPTEASLVRYFLNTTSGDFRRLVLTNELSGTFSVYFPEINPHFYGRPEQQYMYLVRNPFSDNNYIWKYNVKNGKDPKISNWKPGMNIFLTEPVFVPRPSSSVEEDGVLLVGAFNSSSRKGMVFVLDALDITKVLAKIEAPGLTPFGMKNTFVRMADDQMNPYCSLALTLNSFHCSIFCLFLLALVNLF